ncbi:MAG: acetoacetate decarboxylase family protein [Spirosomaceae bacterium]|nr:acetoacetate decarboxylase family protein [Spirosomataceae bacterium]
MYFDSDNLPKPEKTVAPPWSLKGNGYIFIFKFSRAFVEKFGFLSEYQTKSFTGFFGTVMLVDYSESEVGPYQELLFVPGMFNLNNKKIYSIAKIYVSSYDSVWNGIENWGIPKELADFEVISPNKNEDIFTVSMAGKLFFKARLRRRGFYFPISTKFFPLKLAQKLRKNLLITNSPASGKATLAKLVEIEVDNEFFPDIAQAKPLMVLAVKDFEMQFPIPKTIENYFVEP